jgi:hypothetical protein
MWLRVTLSVSHSIVVHRRWLRVRTALLGQSRCVDNT